MKETNQSAVGTSFHMITVSATVEQLQAILGTPAYSDNDGEDKVNFSWQMETNEDNVFTVYDWKEYRPISKNELITWHIGSKSLTTSLTAFDEIQAELSKNTKHLLSNTEADLLSQNHLS
ncbi:MAG TPA: hypothetical protein PK431_16890 [Chitinophagales bacterium]|nr:hypothetical protein [Chitinophagales bacterium]